MKRRKLILRSLLVTIAITVLSGLIILGSTNALFVNKDTQKTVNNYNTGLLSITALSKSNVITLGNTLPMSDIDGALLDPYVFTIKNNGNVNYTFDIVLSSNDTNNFDPDYIKIKVDNDTPVVLSSLTNSKIKTSVTLAAQDSMDISLRVWLDSNTPNSEIGNTFTSELVISGIASDTTSNYGVSAASYITNLYNNAAKTEVTNNSIKYNYATSVNLMNDRLGGTTKDYNAGNIRYYGASPSNYIYFNCTDYNNQSDETCEKWRIIGVFDNMVKIVRNDSIGNLSWDTSSSSVNEGTGINEWSQADIMKLLNPSYENNEDLDNSGNTIVVNNSLYWNASSIDDNINCYNSQNNSTTNSCDFSSVGLKNVATKNKIAEVIWNLGSINNFSLTPAEAYLDERDTRHVSNPADGITRQNTWLGRIALFYISDYGYAVDFGECNTQIDKYDFNTLDNSCYINDWLYMSNHNNVLQATLTTYARTSVIASVRPTGFAGSHWTYSSSMIRPTLFLNSEEVIKGGNGTSSRPYQLK